MFSELLARMSLDGERRANTKHFEEERKLAVLCIGEFGRDALTNECRDVIFHKVRERARSCTRRQGGVRTHPQFRVRLGLVDLEIGDALRRVLCRQARRTLLAPVIALDAWGDLECGWECHGGLYC